MEEKLKRLIKDSLRIEIKEFKDYDSKGFEVKLILDGEEISSDRVYTDSWLD